MKNETTISDKLKLIHDNGIRICPKFNISHRFAVCVEDIRRVMYRDRVTVGEYRHTTRTVNKAIEKTIAHVYAI